MSDNISETVYGVIVIAVAVGLSCLAHLGRKNKRDGR